MRYFPCAALTVAGPFVPLLVLLTILSGGLVRAQQGPAKVDVAPAIRRDLQATFTFVGTVNPARRAVIGSAVDGRLVEIVEDGVWVGKGQPVARMRTGTINIEIQGVKAELALREHELAELEAGSLPEEIAMARAKLEGAKALVDYAKSRYERTRSLRDRGQATSQEEVEQTLSAYVAAENNFLAATAEYDLAVKGPREERKLQARDRVAMQTETLTHLRDRRNKYWARAYFSGYVVKQYAEVGAWIRQGDPLVELIELDPVEIYVNVPEQHIHAVRIGEPAQVRIDALSSKEAWTGVVASINPQADLRTRTFAVKVRLANEEIQGENAPEPLAGAPAGDELSTQPVAAPGDGPGEDSGEAPAAPAADDEVEPSGVIDTPEDAHVSGIEHKQHRFKAGMLARVSLRLGERKGAILVPKDALVLGGSAVDGQPSYTLFVATPTPAGGHLATPVPVAIGMYEGDLVEVVSRVPGALQPGALVVTLGNERLQPMQPIIFGRKTP